MLKPKNVKFLNGNKQLYEQFQKHHVIGHGNSYVYEVKNEQGQSECIKEIILEDKMNEFIFIKEIELLNKLKANPHSNIVGFRGSYTLIQKKTQGKTVKKGYIQMEKGLTNLKAYLSQRKSPFSQDQIISFFSSMIDAFAHLQKIQVAHRDIKPSNILVFDEDPLYFKICDVGAGTAVGECDNTKERTVIGTPYYLSPELYQAFMEKLNLTNYKAYKSDVYSLGLLFVQFALSKKISERLKNEPAQVAQKIKEVKEKYPNIIGLGKVLRNMLEFEVSKRMDFLQLRQFVNDNNLLRNKYDKTLTLSPQLGHKLTQHQIFIQGIQQLPQLHAIVSTNSKITNLRIRIEPNVKALKASEKQLLNELAKIRHMKLEELEIDIEICEIEDRHLRFVADGLEKNLGLRKLGLNFWNNQISNDSFMHLMRAITTNLVNLQTLILYFPSNNLKIDDSYKTLFTFSTMPNLTSLSLNLSFNTISSEGLFLITKQISQSCHKALTHLSLTLESIKTNPIHFGKAVKNLMGLEVVREFKINVSGNSVRDEGMFAISDVVRRWGRLARCEMILRSCEVQDKGFGEFMKELAQGSELKELKINLLSNQLTEKGTNNFAKHFEALVNIKSLDLNISNNPGFNDGAIRLLSKSLLMIKGITKLRLLLDSLDLSEKGCLYLGRLISEQPLLQELELSLKHDDIKLAGIQYISAGLLKVKRIRKLKICFEATNIGDESANYLAMCLLKMRHLTNVQLNLDNCNLTNQTVENIIKTVKECSKKTQQITINLRKNQQLKLELYEQIKKDLQGSRIAIRLDNPNDGDDSPLKKSLR